MLALYDAADNALQNDEQELDESDLYERLLVSFAQREVRKTRPHLTAEPLKAAVESELLRLSVVAYSMFNRGRQWAAEDELSAEPWTHCFAATTRRPRLQGSTAGDARADRHRPAFLHPPSPGPSHDRRLTTCEFLHATFGEYLIARLTAHELRDLCPRSPPCRCLATARSRPTDSCARCCPSPR